MPKKPKKKSCSGQQGDCPNEPAYKFVNGEEKDLLCSVCLREELFDLVTVNDTMAFHSGDLPVRRRGVVVKTQVVEVEVL